MLHRTASIEYKRGTVLEVAFQDGQVKRYDVSCLFDKYPQLMALKDRKLFKSGKLTYYGIIWNEELDLDAETIYEDGATVRTVDIGPCVMVGCELARARAEKDMSQSKLAEITHIDQSDLSKIERGVANPSIRTLNRIAEALDYKLVISFEPK